MDEKAKAEAGKAKAADTKDEAALAATVAAAQAVAAKAKGEAAKGIPDFSMGWGVLMVMLMAFIAIKRSNKSV